MAVYSRRFALGTGPADVIYTVPAGYRAIIKCMTAYNAGSGNAGVGVWIGSVPVWSTSIGGTSGTVITNLMIVVNAGEVLKIGPSANVNCQVSGFLLPM